jgi:hypothetical protein
MQRFRILGVALMAVFALSAVVSATASAEVVMLPEITTTEKWTGESGKGSLEVLKGAAVIECKKDKSEGTFEPKKPLGSFHIDFEGCKASIATCTGLGEPVAGTILTLGTFHLVYDTLGSVLSEAGVGVLFLVLPTHFECTITNTLLVVEGEVLCLIKPVNTEVKHWEIVCERGATAGDPKETVYWNEAGTKIQMGENLLLTHENEKAGVMSSELTTALILSINRSFSIMT